MQVEQPAGEKENMQEDRETYTHSLGDDRPEGNEWSQYRESLWRVLYQNWIRPDPSYERSQRMLRVEIRRKKLRDRRRAEEKHAA